MSLADLEEDIEDYVTECSSHLLLKNKTDLVVIKYMAGKFLGDVISSQHLYASERAGFTWGDALYVSPVEYPRATMMYGQVGVVGTYAISSARFFDADKPVGLDLYQKWITYQVALFRELTTTVHANSANRQLRNDFRTRFQIDCVLFKPDEPCADYVDGTVDWWLAISNWDITHIVAPGYSKAISNLKFVVIGPDSFETSGKGYKANIHTSLSGNYTYKTAHYTSLESDIRNAYSSSAANVVLLCDFK